ncbi:TPA: acyltransferase [Serratia marcescens]|nr:acyltransferase [Serratia marcescens]HEP0988794.1 acyltransferase [Serratia marcescens]
MKFSGQINSVQILRGIAALVVILYHTNHKTIHLGMQADNVFSWGEIGVDIFFIISGFIMMLVTEKQISKLKFFKDRVTRIIPAYWTVTLIALIAFLLAPSLVNSSGGETGVVQSFTLIKIPYDIKFLVQNGWTLTFEFFFYIILAFFINQERVRKLGFSLLAFIIIDMLFATINKDAESFLNDPIKYEFIFGASLYLILSGTLREKLTGIAFIIIAALSATSMSFTYTRTIEAGLPALIFVLTIISIERVLISHKDKVKPMLYLGEISYSLYLVHPFVIQAIAIAAKKIKYLQNTSVFFLLVIVVSIIASHVFYMIIEKGLTKRIKTLSTAKA